MQSKTWSRSLWPCSWVPEQGPTRPRPRRLRYLTEDTGDTAFEEVSIPGEDAILTIISPENGNGDVSSRSCGRSTGATSTRPATMTAPATSTGS